LAQKNDLPLGSLSHSLAQGPEAETLRGRSFNFFLRACFEKQNRLLKKIKSVSVKFIFRKRKNLWLTKKGERIGKFAFT